MKKGDLSINIIIVAAIALIILVILSVLIFGTGGDLRRAKSCDGLQGACRDAGESCSDYNTEDQTWIRHYTAKCNIENQICCIPQ
jgi:hypothetical protein